MSDSPHTRQWNPAPNSSGEDLDRQDVQFLKLAVNMLRGRHGSSIPRSMTIAGDERVLILGPQTTPVGVVVTLQPGSVMTTL